LSSLSFEAKKMVDGRGYKNGDNLKTHRVREAAAGFQTSKEGKVDMNMAELFVDCVL